MKINMWFGDKIDYEITDDNKKYFNIMLKDLFGYDSFRNGQLDVIKNILENNIENIPLSVFPTGYGKSLIYQFCALLEPQRTIVIVPTEVLACDQIFNLNECGLNVGQVISCYEKNINDRNGNLIYYTIPDVFLNNDLNDKLSNEDKNDRIYNIVLDECHNISLWGHQFDPTYFSISKNIISNFKNCNVTMFTATASKLVIDDISNQFSDKDIDIYQPVGLKRGHINYQIKKVNGLEDIIKDISNIYNKNYGKKNEWDLKETNRLPNKTLIINNDPAILNQIYSELQENDNILPDISLYDNTVNNYKAFRTGRSKILVTNDDFVVGINIPNLVNLICIGVPPSKEWLYQESGRVGREFENSNVIIYLPKQPSDLFNKMIDTTFDIKDLLANKELQSKLNIDVSNINYFNSYFQNKEKQLDAFDYVHEQIEENIYVIGKSDVGELNVNFATKDKELYNYLLYMMVLLDYIRIWQTRSSDIQNIIKYRLFARAKIDFFEMKDYLNQIIRVSTNNKEVRNKYIRLNNKSTQLRELLNNLLDWYYETIITIKREMMVNTYELLLTEKIDSEEIEQNLAVYFDISSNIREDIDNFELDDYNEDEVVNELEVKGAIESETEEIVAKMIEESPVDLSEYENKYFNDIDKKPKDETNKKVEDSTIKTVRVKKPSDNNEKVLNDHVFEELDVIASKEPDAKLVDEALKNAIKVTNIPREPVQQVEEKKEEIVENEIKEKNNKKDNVQKKKVEVDYKDVIKEEKEKKIEVKPLGDKDKKTTIKKEVKEESKTSKSRIDSLLSILSNIYDDKEINFEFFDLYKSLNDGEKYNLQFILQREIESGYIYGYELMISIIDLETKGSNLVRFNKFAKNTNQKLLELLVEKDSSSIPHSNKKKAYKIIYSLYKPNSIFDRLKKWI